MKQRSRLIALAALALFAAAAPASANIAPPNMPTKPPRQTTGAPIRMQLRPDAEAKEARLIIPRKVFKQLKAELDGGEDTQTAAAVASGGSNLSSAQTAVAGVFLSLSLVLGGVWLAGSRAPGRRVSRVVSALALVALGGAAASGVAVYANVGPPPAARSLTSKILSPDLSYWGASGVVKVEIADDESLIMLVLPKTKDAATAGE